MAKKPTKREIRSALNALTETRNYAEEVRRTEGNREAGAYLGFRGTVVRCSNAIALLERAGHDLPEWLAKNRPHYKTLGW